MFVTLAVVGLVAGLLSGAVGFDGSMILLPFSTIAQLMNNLSRVAIGWKSVNWRAVAAFLLLAVPFTALGAFGFAKVPKGPMAIVLCVFLIIFAILKLTGKMKLPHKPLTMMLGNFIAMRFIRNVNKDFYKKIVAGVMIVVSLWMIISRVV